MVGWGGGDGKTRTGHKTFYDPGRRWFPKNCDARASNLVKWTGVDGRRNRGVSEIDQHLPVRARDPVVAGGV